MISGQIEAQRGLTTANDASKLFKNVVQIPWGTHFEFSEWHFRCKA